MTLVLLACTLFLVTGVIALCGGSARWATVIGAGGVIIGSMIGVIPSLGVLLSGTSVSVHVPWDVPYGAFIVVLDPLAAFFLVPIFFLSAVAALYGTAYLEPYRDRKSVGVSWFFFTLLVASMTLVVIAHNGVLFLMAWEVMALSSFFLVTFEDEQEQVQYAGWVYLVATHVGTAFVFVLFLLLGREHGSLDFDHFTAAAGPSLLFVLAVIGFGTKAGFMPLHIWLPEAHPAAPTHVSALMSGVMIKTGIYGLVRTLMILGPPSLWWGWLLCAIGVGSGILGILSALAQHDLKRALAYSSVENIGIITLGLGLSVIGVSTGSATIAVCGLAGALLHVVNHSLFKGSLFFGAGAVMHATGTRDLNSLGGLLQRMPWTGVAFLIGAVAITGVPPLNGFVSEFLLYLGALHGTMTLSTTSVAPALAVITALALIGGLSAACFANLCGMVFLGGPRSQPAAHAHEVGGVMRLAMGLLTVGCVGIAALSPVFVSSLSTVLVTVTRLPTETVTAELAVLQASLSHVILVSGGAIMVCLGLAGLRWHLLRGRTVDTQVTWDCGYAQPTVRMQYTASSFVQPLTSLFAPVLGTRRQQHMAPGLFPSTASLATVTEDLPATRLYQPLLSTLGRVLALFRWVQQGQVHLYVLYIALTLLVLLVWKLG